MDSLSLKPCSKCGELKPKSEYYEKGNCCKSCAREYAKKRRSSLSREVEREKERIRKANWRTQHPEKAKSKNTKTKLKIKYSLNIAEYEKMLAAQGGVCAICGGVNENGSRLSVDHDHKTGKVRGLLCSKCNSGIGFFRDSISALVSAIRYLTGIML